MGSWNRCCGVALSLVAAVSLSAVPLSAAHAAIQGSPISVSVDASSALLSDDQQNPFVLQISDKGLWFVIWEDWRNWRTTGADIYGRFIKSDGTFCGDEVAVSTDIGHQTVPKMAYRDVFGDTGDKVAVIWQDSRASSGANNIRFKEITIGPSVDCSALSSSIGVETTDHQISYTGTQYWEGEWIDLNPTVDGNDDDSITDNDRDLWTTHMSPLNDTLRSRKKPVISYDQVNDQFWMSWIESRSQLNSVSERCFGFSPQMWSFGDEDSVGYVVVDADTLVEQANSIGVNGADIIRNDLTRTVRHLSNGGEGALGETYHYEFFSDINNVTIANGISAPETYFVWEGAAMDVTLTCTCDDINQNQVCDMGDPDNGIPSDEITSNLTTESLNDGNIHIGGISSNLIHLASAHADWIDNGGSGASGFFPAIALDPVQRKFLVAWEDTRDGANIKTYGQLMQLGGGHYNQNFIVSYSDSDADGAQDPNVAGNRQTRPAIAYDTSHQRFFVTWQDGRNTRTSLQNLDIYGQFIDSEGSLRGENMPISLATGNQYDPVTAYNRDNHQFLTVWKDSSNANTDEGQDTFSDIVGQRFSLGQPQLNLVNTDNTTLVPPLFDFGVLTVGQTSSQTMKLVNSGDTYVEVDCVEPYQDGRVSDNQEVLPFKYAFPIPTELRTCNDGLSLRLVPSSEYLLSVQFEPTAPGTYISNFTVSSDAGSPTVFLQGIANSVDTVETTASITTVPGPDSGVDCGTIGTTESRSVNLQVKNTGNTDVTVTALDLPTSGTPFSITGIGPGTTIAADSVLYAVVQCDGAAVDAADDYSATLRILFDSAVAEVALPLKATVSSEAVVTGETTTPSTTTGNTTTWQVYDTWDGAEVSQADPLLIGVAANGSVIGTWGNYQFPISYTAGVGWTWSFTNGTYTWYYTITSVNGNSASGYWTYRDGSTLSQSFPTRAVRIQ
ncbi:hypothetical protein JCM17961_44460 [Endothiovibrio diazotrophicus]